MMRPLRVFGAALGAMVLGLAAEEVKFSSELRLTPSRKGVPGPAPAKVPGPLAMGLMSACSPTIDLKRTPAGEVSVEFVLRIGNDGVHELNTKHAEEFADLLDLEWKNGRGVAVIGGKDARVIAEKLAGGRKFRLVVRFDNWNAVASEKECRWYAAYFRASLKEFATFSKAWEAYQRGEKGVTFAESKLESWRVIHHLGAVELKEFGNFWMFLEGGGESKGENWERTSLSPMGTALMAQPSLEMVEALAQIPKHFEEGKVFRWKTREKMLRAFPENKAIFYRPDVRREKDERIHVTTALEARRIIRERDRLKVWYEAEGRSALRALVEKGEAAFFEVWK